MMVESVVKHAELEIQEYAKSEKYELMAYMPMAHGAEKLEATIIQPIDDDELNPLFLS